MLAMSARMSATREPSEFGRKFTKVAMIASIQYFPNRDLSTLLANMKAVMADGASALITAVPDRERQGVFYNTPGRRLRRAWERLTGEDQFGTWWDALSMSSSCRALRLSCSFLPADTESDKPYRFNVRIVSARPAAAHA